VSIHGHVAGESSFDATIIYVSTTPGAPKVVPVPEWVRAAFAADEQLSLQ
jgi:acyl-CoA thioesterase FadM